MTSFDVIQAFPAAVAGRAGAWNFIRGFAAAWRSPLAAAHKEAMSLGAKLLQAKVESESPDAFQVYADPAGHPFCLCFVKDA